MIISDRAHLRQVQAPQPHQLPRRAQGSLADGRAQQMEAALPVVLRRARGAGWREVPVRGAVGDDVVAASSRREAAAQISVAPATLLVNTNSVWGCDGASVFRDT